MDSSNAMVSEITHVVVSTPSSASTSRSPFDLANIDVNYQPTAIRPTGQAVIDALLGGGLRGGEVIGLLGPSNSGKTLLCIQTAIEMSRHIKPESPDVVDYFTCNEPQRAIWERIWIGSTGFTRQDISGLSTSEMRPGVQEAIRRESLRLLKSDGRTSAVQVIDLSDGLNDGGWTGMAAVDAMLQQQTAKKLKPRCVFVDSVGSLVLKQMAAENVADSQLRQHIVMAMTEARAIARRYDVTVFMVDRLSREAGCSNPFFTNYDNAECNRFAALCDSCLVCRRIDRICRILRVTNLKPDRTGGKAAVSARNPKDTHQLTFLEQ